jgi:acyl-CoA thioesterase I
MRRTAMAAVAAAALTAGLAAPAPARAECAVPPALTALGTALDRSAARLGDGKGLTIVAVGSSSTAGYGASRPDRSYPSRLAQELRLRFPQVAIHVVNHGVGGEDIGQEVARLARDVIAERPDLVIWQVGTNAVLRRENLAADAPLIERGITAIRARGIDLVLMDMQYAPRVLAHPAYGVMEQLIADAARRAHVGLFRRFAIMQRWARTGQLAPEPLIGADGVHMTDASYGCLAVDLAAALTREWSSQLKLARSPRRTPAALVGLARAPETAPTASVGAPR